jgi:hypothetical protein
MEGQNLTDKESATQKRSKDMTLTGSKSPAPGPGLVQAKDGDRFAAWLADLTWGKLYPEGCDLYYEGAHPDKFAKAIGEEFGFDPAADPLWGKTVEGDDGSSAQTSYGFHCPADKIDAIHATYGCHRFPGRVRILHEYPGN